MTIKLYKTDASSAVRAVYLTVNALGLEVQYIDVNLTAREHFHPEFLKLNPQHTVPTIEDDGKALWDSHAIMIYLVSKYGRDDDFLYPKDPYKRAIIDQRLHFESGVLFVLGRRIMKKSLIYGSTKEIPDDVFEEVDQAYELLEKLLEDHDWVAGDELTVADFSLLSTVTSLNVSVPIDPDKYPNVIEWIERGKQLPYYYVNEKGLDEFKVFIEKLRSQ